MLSKDGKESEANEMSKRNKSYSLLQAVKICSQQIHNNFGTNRTETRERERKYDLNQQSLLLWKVLKIGERVREKESE